jgi:phosphoglycolate phosphatase
MNLKLIVFDWDGTLMDSEARIVTCMQGALADVGLVSQSREQVREIIGLGLPQAVQTLVPDHPTLHARIIQHYRERYLGEGVAPSPLFDGAAAVIERLVAQDFLLAVATGKSRRGLDQSLEQTGLRHLFHATRCADEARSKPHPEMLLQLMDELGALPQETLMIGDTEFDMALATNAGAQCLAVGYGVHPRERLLQHGPLGCVDRVTEIPAWVEHLGSRDKNTFFQDKPSAEGTC